MSRKKNTKVLALVLAMSLVIGTPASVMAANEVPNETAGEAEIISDFSEFMSALKKLEEYAAEYASINTSEDTTALVLNYIRTGVDDYTSDSWEILAGSENTAFTSFVAEKDSEKGTAVSSLKNLDVFTLPNGNEVEFGHMFGTMDISYHAIIQGVSDDVALARADMGGWAGDICDLMMLTKDQVAESDVETMAETIRNDFLGLDVEDAESFGQQDIYGDLDAFYLMNELKSSDGSLSSVMENYFTSDLTDESRAAYFLENRLGSASSKNDIRNAVAESYSGNTLIFTLEASRNLSNCDMLRTACCYAFADYLYGLAGNEEGGESGGETGGDPETPDNKYYTVFSNTTTTLAPGVTQDITYALTSDDKQIVYYTATIDTSRDDISIYANYNNNDGSKWGMSRVTDQMASAQAKHSDPNDEENYIENYNTILGVNADFYNMSTGQPSGALVMEGTEYHGVGSENFFAILDDGTPIIGTPSDYETYKDQIKEAVGGSIYLVKDGEIAVTASSDYYNNRASRTCVGITADNKVVMMVLDGRQEPFSAGGSSEEIAQIMLEAGCVTAINLDGGGSTTFAAKQEGDDEVSVVNRPSDGYERSVSSSLLVVSTAETSNEFDHALIETENDYLTVGSTLTLEASGVSSSGNAAALPENAVWNVTDPTIGSIDGDVFTAAKTGTTDIQIVADGNVVGSKTVSVVVPDTLLFTEDKIDVVYGHEEVLPIAATYNGNTVAINSNDVEFVLSNVNAGTIDGFNFTGNEESGIRNITVTARLATNYSITAELQIALYSEDEAIFDFDNAMFGNRNLAWNRDVSNSTTTDNITYYVETPDEDMSADYTFAIDMQSVAIPEQLKELVKMIAGGDLESATAWNLLLQLAERVSTLTEVQAVVQFDKNVDVDYSELKVVNDYFELGNAELDEDTNTLTVNVKWIKQTEAIPSETANPIVILSGIKLTPKDDANWNEDNCLTLVNSGSIYYDIYLRAGTLYTMASQPAFQQAYGIYPFINPDDSSERGGHLEAEFISFEDTYTLDNTIKEGWTEFNGNIYYFENNKPLTGIQFLPGYQDEENSYYYDLGDDGIYSGKLTGLFELDGDKYYSVNGVLQSSWRLITNSEGEDEYYYFDRQSYKAVDGEQTISGYDYVFENNILVRGDWLIDENGIRFVWAGAMMRNKWFTTEGHQYFAYADSYLATGIAKTLNHERTGEEVYVFDENGVWLEDLSGFYDYEGATYLVDNGVRVAYPGLVLIDGNYYYFNSSNTMVKGRDYYISKTNGLKPAATYTFDEDGKLVEKEILNGIIKEDDTNWYYYVDGVKTYAGLIQIDGYYYYVNSSFHVIHGQEYYISKTNGLMPQDYYTFDEDGKMVLHDTSLNGIVKEDDGTWYYYVDGVKTYAGLIQIDGDYYYVNSSFHVIHDCDYAISKTNGLLPQKVYTFDSEGKIVFPEEVLNGIVKEDDANWYYYVDGVKTYAGLIQIDGDYYYVNSSFHVIHNQTYAISKTNGLMPQGNYTFDSEGKMVTEDKSLNGIVKEEDGNWYYYVNGVKTYAGLIQIDGDYYYVNSSFHVIHDQSYYISKTNGLLPNATYQFDSEGKLMLE